MPRGAATQTRTFTFHSNGQLISSTNPETGTVTFVYNSNGQMTSKTDAKGQKTEYTYDSQNRVTAIQRYNTGSSTPDPNQAVTYHYDSNPYDPSFSQAATGRLAAKRLRVALLLEAHHTIIGIAQHNDLSSPWLFRPC
ncbi:MAG: hypothetical protein FJW20_02295 [Acidimicrobiia bacterium]|nr:hypothetical protein [Acidimicrobiia bacterium]